MVTTIEPRLCPCGCHLHLMQDLMEEVITVECDYCGKRARVSLKRYEQKEYPPGWFEIHCDQNGLGEGDQFEAVNTYCSASCIIAVLGGTKS